jgi:hypothetical protein
MAGIIAVKVLLIPSENKCAIVEDLQREIEASSVFEDNLIIYQFHIK